MRRREGAAQAPGPADAARPGRRSRASSGTTQADIDVANALPRNGPSGWYSNRCTSRALQSFTSTTPNSDGPGPQRKPSSHSKSRACVGPNEPGPSMP